MRARTIFWGLILIVIGLLMWLSNLEVIPFGISFGRDWPVILVVIGIMGIVEGISRTVKNRFASHKITCGLLFLMVGLWIWLSNLDVLNVSFKENWPLIIVVAGIYVIARRAGISRRNKSKRHTILGDLEKGKIDVETAINKIRQKR
jgi:hypothetical protein